MSQKVFQLSSLSLMAAGALAFANPAEAAFFGSGQLDLSNVGIGGNAIYTKNAIDFTEANDAGGNAISNPGDPGLVGVSGTGDLNSLTGQAEIFDLFSPVEITTDTRFTFAPGTLKFLEFEEGTEYFITALTRTGSNTGVQDFQLEGYFENEGDRTFSTFNFVTGQAPVPISETTLISSLDQIDDPGTVNGETSYSGTILVEQPDIEIPEPATIFGLFAVGTLAAATLKRKQRA
jgi:PEP-CTERM motif